ncbi:uncharacterized protein LOC126723494 isoform X2 [Quercus robur]|uniref:uncharacterized protein LOC126723494 isoform X2 n=1 Tax=Quercus robur TaxID=38942 RepID=UPI002161F82C|nr:uncharacterized protein LOC126723494 isoform X2 [Quercus robur]
MAEGALFHLAEKVLELLRSLTLQEVKLASSVKTEIEKLTNTVTTIQAVILDAEKQSSQDHQIKDWLRKLKDVLHDADDLLDDFSTDVLRQKVMTKKELFIFQWLNLLDLVAPSTAAASTSSPNTSEVPKTGLNTTFQGGLLKDVAESVIKWARDGLERRGIGESMYLNELAEDVITGVTPAEKLAQMYNEKWGKNVYPVFEELRY